jgi:hypothetical protein
MKMMDTIHDAIKTTAGHITNTTATAAGATTT